MIENRTSWRSRRWAGLVGAPIAVVALLGLTACGTNTDPSTSAAASASAEAPADDADDADDAPGTEPAAYQSCLEENGVTMPERAAGGAPAQGGTPPTGAPAGGQGGPGGAPGQAPPGVDDDTWEAAQEACSDLAPTPPDGAAPTAASPAN